MVFLGLAKVQDPKELCIDNPISVITRSIIEN